MQKRTVLAACASRLVSTHGSHGSGYAGPSSIPPAFLHAGTAYEDTAVKLVAALREAISADLSDAEERQVRCGGVLEGGVCELRVW